MDYYKILGLPRNASQEAIQKAYHELAVKHHPDANPGDTQAAEKFKEINKAYQILRDPEKRKEYDAGSGGSRPGTNKRPNPGTAPRRDVGGGGTPPPMSGNPLFDILNDMRGTARANAGTTASGSDMTGEKASGTPTVEIKLTPREAVEGTTKTIKINGRPLRIKITIVQ